MTKSDFRAMIAASAVASAGLVAPAGACTGDLNGDFSVDGADLGMLLAAWNMPSSPADLNEDGLVDGADLGILLAHWGPCLLPLECIPSYTAILESDGTYELGDWTVPGWMLPYAANPAAFGGSYSVSQWPSAATQVIGPSDLPVTITVQGVNGALSSCTFALQVVDRTAPDVTVEGVQNGESFVAPRGPAAQMSASDAVTPGPRLATGMELDGEPYVAGTAITEPGFHTLRAHAVDAAGNRGEARSVTFEIREYPKREAVALVESMLCNQTPAGATLDAVIVLASSTFAAHDLDIDHLALWALDADGIPLNAQLLYVDGSTNPDGTYSSQGAQAIYQQGYWRLHFSVPVPDGSLQACPTSLWLTSSANADSASRVDVEAQCPAVAVPNAVAVLAGLGLLNADPAEPPPPKPPCPPCRWRSEWHTSPFVDHVSSSHAGCAAGKQTYFCFASAGDGSMYGNGGALNECTGQAYGSLAAKSGDALLHVWLEGRRECCGPLIKVELDPSFEAKASLTSGGTATGHGMIDERSWCGNAFATADGEASLAAKGDETKTIWGHGFGTCALDYATVRVQLTATVSVYAEKTTKSWAPKASSSVDVSRLRIHVTAQCTANPRCTTQILEVRLGF